MRNVLCLFAREMRAVFCVDGKINVFVLWENQQLVFMEKSKFLFSGQMDEVCHGLKRIYTHILVNEDKKMDMFEIESGIKQTNDIFSINAHYPSQELRKKETKERQLLQPGTPLKEVFLLFAHSALFTCHPGHLRTFRIIRHCSEQDILFPSLKAYTLLSCPFFPSGAQGTYAGVYYCLYLPSPIICMILSGHLHFSVLVCLLSKGYFPLEKLPLYIHSDHQHFLSTLVILYISGF